MPESQQVTDAKEKIVKNTTALLAELDASPAVLGERAAVPAAINALKADMTTAKASAGTIAAINAVQSKLTDPNATDYAAVLAALYDLQFALDEDTLDAKDKASLAKQLLTEIANVRRIMSYRPNVEAVMADLEIMKNLKGGPADAVSYHDFHVLQMAFKSIWLHAFDANLQEAAGKLYEETVRHFDELGLPTGDLPEVLEVSDLTTLTRAIEGIPSPPIPPNVDSAFSGMVTNEVWARLGEGQRDFISKQADTYQAWATGNLTLKFEQINEIVNKVKAIVDNPDGTRNRLANLVLKIGKMLSEPYAFDVFAQDSYNFGLITTYRQRWEPLSYQAGDLVATIPLAPGESRKFTKRKVLKTSRMVKEAERTMQSMSRDSSETTRAESEILRKVATSTNFKMSSHGSFDIGLGSFENTTELISNQDQQSTDVKKAFHEATLKAAEAYRKERSVEVDTSTSLEIEETTSGEISNPNNEITVTYLFYELQRRFAVREFLHQVRPVVMIAQDVPSPNEIDEAWLIRHQWIIDRSLLDDSFRPALSYLASGFAGDEVAIEVAKAHWQKQRQLVDKLEQQVEQQQLTRDTMRESLVETTLKADLVPEMPGALKVFTFGVDPSDSARKGIEAYQKAGETRLKYVEQALTDAQEKLTRASNAFADATKAYSAALQNRFSRNLTIDQLRVHVKDNILYYMQAIWSHEFEDQRFFRLYNKKISCPKIDSQKNVDVTVNAAMNATGLILNAPQFADLWKNAPAGGPGEHELIEIADIDNPLGFKGNYIIFPLKGECPLTTFMLTRFFDSEYGLTDPDGSDTFDEEGFDARWNAPGADRAALRKELEAHMTRLRRSSDEVIVPTGQLFIEALPGSHALLEDFKLLHRFEDVRKVRAEVRHAELENLRLAARLMEGQTQPDMLEDPEIEKKIVVDGL